MLISPAGCIGPTPVRRNPGPALGMRHCLPFSRINSHRPLHHSAPSPGHSQGHSTGLRQGFNTGHQAASSSNFSHRKGAGLSSGFKVGLRTAYSAGIDPTPAPSAEGEVITVTESAQSSGSDRGGVYDWGDRPSVMYRCIVAYDGTNYSGFQLQNGRTDAPTVQGKLERAIRDLTKQPREVDFLQ